MPFGELRDRLQFIINATSMQEDQPLAAEVIHEREDLIPGEIGTTGQELFTRNTLSLLNDDQ